MAKRFPGMARYSGASLYHPDSQTPSVSAPDSNSLRANYSLLSAIVKSCILGISFTSTESACSLRHPIWASCWKYLFCKDNQGFWDNPTLGLYYHWHSALYYQMDSSETSWQYLGAVHSGPSSRYSWLASGLFLAALVSMTVVSHPESFAP